MQLRFTAQAWDDYLYWQSQDMDVLRKINGLIKDIRRDPFRGVGQPEALKGDLAGWWSRRVTQEHRLVYRVRGKGEEQEVQIAQCRLHY